MQVFESKAPKEEAMQNFLLRAIFEEWSCNTFVFVSIPNHMHYIPEK